MRLTRGNGLFEDFLSRKRAEKANSFIPESYRKGRILDIGCGFYPYFLINTDFKEKHGVDPAVSTGLIRDKSVNVKKIDVSKNQLPFRNGNFDVVTMLAVFEHIEHDKLSFVLPEIKRVLKNEGIFIITTPAPWADRLLHQMAKLRLISPEEIHEHKHHQSRLQIENVIIKSGFDKQKIKSGYFELGFNMWFTAVK